MYDSDLCLKITTKGQIQNLNISTHLPNRQALDTSPSVLSPASMYFPTCQNILLPSIALLWLLGRWLQLPSNILHCTVWLDSQVFLWTLVIKNEFCGNCHSCKRCTVRVAPTGSSWQNHKSAFPGRFQNFSFLRRNVNYPKIGGLSLSLQQKWALW